MYISYAYHTKLGFSSMRRVHDVIRMDELDSRMKELISNSYNNFKAQAQLEELPFASL